MCYKIDELTFDRHLRELTTKIIGEDAFQNHYLKKTHKPENLPVKQWLNHVKNITSYLPYIKQNATVLTDEDLIWK
jgi:hypothetical protein